MKEKIPALDRNFSDFANARFVVVFRDYYEEKNKHAADVSHIHDVCEIYLNISGDVSFVVENSVYPISRGDMIISAPDEFHHCVYHSDGVCKHYCLWIDGLPQRYLRAFYDRNGGEKNLISVSCDEKERLINCFEKLCNAQKNDALSLDGIMAFVEILSIIDENRNASISSAAVPSLLSGITGYIDSEYSCDCSIENLCNTFFVSRSTLCRLFRTYLGTTPAKYVASRRLSEAKKMLKAGSSVGDACFACGFTDYSHFIALFKSRFGITPMKYARNRSEN